MNISNIENLLLNEDDKTKSDFLLIRAKLNEYNVKLENDNSHVMFANHLLMLIKRLQSGEKLNTYYFEDDKQFFGVKTRSILIAEEVLKPLFSKYDVDIIYTELLLSAMHIQAICDKQDDKSEDSNK